MLIPQSAGLRMKSSVPAWVSIAREDDWAVIAGCCPPTSAGDATRVSIVPATRNRESVDDVASVSRYLRHADEAAVGTARRRLEDDQSGLGKLFANSEYASGTDRLQTAEIHVTGTQPVLLFLSP